MTTEVCTTWYRAPEIFDGDAYGSSVDLWSAECTIVELFSRNYLFLGKDKPATEGAIERVLKHQLLPHRHPRMRNGSYPEKWTRASESSAASGDNRALKVLMGEGSPPNFVSVAVSVLAAAAVWPHVTGSGRRIDGAAPARHLLTDDAMHLPLNRRNKEHQPASRARGALAPARAAAEGPRSPCFTDARFRRHAEVLRLRPWLLLMDQEGGSSVVDDRLLHGRTTFPTAGNRGAPVSLLCHTLGTWVVSDGCSCPPTATPASGCWAPMRHTMSLRLRVGGFRWVQMAAPGGPRWRSPSPWPDRAGTPR